MITLKWWQIALLMFLAGVVSAAVGDIVHAGTTFTQLSKSVEIVDWDKWIKERDKSLEYARNVQEAYVFCSSEVVE